jgi:hypothetical protein
VDLPVPLLPEQAATKLIPGYIYGTTWLRLTVPQVNPVPFTQAVRVLALTGRFAPEHMPPTITNGASAVSGDSPARAATTVVSGDGEHAESGGWWGVLSRWIGSRTVDHDDGPDGGAWSYTMHYSLGLALVYTLALTGRQAINHLFSLVFLAQMTRSNYFR